MGYVKVEAEVCNSTDHLKSTMFTLLADPGALYTAILEDVVKTLDVKPFGARKFKIASGEVKEYPVGEPT